jgi:hypothetical protein
MLQLEAYPEDPSLLRFSLRSGGSGETILAFYQIAMLFLGK